MEVIGVVRGLIATLICRGISIMEDEGRIGDHTAGIAATDGSWHHIAVSWSSHDGLATLYDNGHKVCLSLG